MLTVEEITALKEAGFTPDQIMEYSRMSGDGSPAATEPEDPPGQPAPAAKVDPMEDINKLMFQ